MESFRELYRSYSLGIFASLRRAQLDRMANFREIPDENLLAATAYYTSMLYTLGILASRLQGFRFEWQCKFPYSMSDPVRNLLDIVYLTVDQLVADCLFAAEPATNAILVTNNLFPFNCDSLAQAVVFRQFDVQIVSEETAQAIQIQMNKVREGTFLPQIPGSFPSAALLAMKPTSGVKRNNAVANAGGLACFIGIALNQSDEASSKLIILKLALSVLLPTEMKLKFQNYPPQNICSYSQNVSFLNYFALITSCLERSMSKQLVMSCFVSEGGNTAHKKSDVNSKESVVIMPSYNDSLNSWQATYPHLLCTTRQKDTVLLDSRAGQIGKRPVFYFYIRATTFSPSGGLSYARSLSLPFTIATRRNQDCQVQRMMSSYTATCFWLYGTSTLDGLILNWSDNGKGFSSYKTVNYYNFSSHSGIKWSHFKQLYQTYFTVNAEVKRSLSDIDFQLMKEKMECEDCREHATASGEEPLLTFKNVLCPHLRYDCDQNVLRFSIWRGNLEVLQIFQDARTNVKQLWDDFILHGLTDIDDIEYVLSAEHLLVPVTQLVEKYKIGTDLHRVRSVQSNITHSGSLENTCEMSFTPLRVAVVTCRETSPETVLPTVPMNDYIGSANHVQVRFRQT
uniref:E3 ubiquitin-protein ligase n=1 Tax=Angiostrongylus cantonensis TaxID=6313 RepID=A0A158P9M6_ANGCA